MNLALLEAELRRDEGVRYMPYLDSRGYKTAGVGHLLSGAPLPAGWSYPLTDVQVDQWLAQDISAALYALDQKCPWWRSMDEVRQRVIANMCFNLGITKLLGFKHALASMQAGDYPAAAAGMRASSWYGQVKDRAVRLCEAMETGVMPDEPCT
jgi:lysozyme